MALGYIAKATKVMNRHDVTVMNKVAFRFFMPALMFYNIYTSDLSSSIKPSLILYAVCSVLVVYFLTMLYVLKVEKDKFRQGVMMQGIYRSNFVIIGLPIAESLMKGKPLGTVAVLIAVIVPLYNVIAVITLEVFNGNKINTKKIITDILKNPLIISSVLGIIAVALNIKFPPVIIKVLKDVTAAGTPLMLFLLGAFFEFKGIGKYKKELIQVCIGRLIVVPGVFLTIAMKLGFTGIDFVGLIGMFGSATAVSSFTMAEQMGGDADLAGNIVVLTSALCSFTLFLWSFIFKSLGVY